MFDPIDLIVFDIIFEILFSSLIESFYLFISLEINGYKKLIIHF